jgi:hypothetical protein
MRMAWLLGIVLGIVLAVLALMVIPGILEGLGISPKADSSMHAFVLVVLIMLSIILLRQQPPSRSTRIIRPRTPEETGR